MTNTKKGASLRPGQGYTGLLNEMGELSTEEWKKQKKIQRAIFTAKQNLPYEVKLRLQARRAWEFWAEMESQDKNCHVSVGGLDSITLFIWLHSIGIHVTGITVSGIEDQSIQKVHRALGLEVVKSYKSKVTILNEIGFPVISKKIAGRINTLQNPTENNKTVRHAIITGECGAQGHYAKNSRMQLPQKWLRLFGGYENENEGVNYGKPEPDIKISNECCYWLKEKPCDDWAKNHNSSPYLGIMASEGGQREEALIDHGCNYYGKTVTRSAPFAIFMRQDILQLALDMDRWYHEHLALFEKLYHAQPYGRNRDGSPKEYVPLESIVPEIYGTIASGRMENSTQQEHREPDAACAVLASIWSNGRIGLTSSGSATRKNGNSGCIAAAQIPTLAKNMAGEGCWTISAWSGRTFRRCR